jgi:undecaprenyl pyrophosphate synthase
MAQPLPKSPVALEQLLKDCAQTLDYWKRAYQRSEFYIQTVKAMSDGAPIAGHLAGRLPEIVVDRDLALATPVSELLLLHLDGEAVARVQAEMTAAAAIMERFSDEADPKLAIQREVEAHEQMSQAMLSMIDQLTRLRHHVLAALEPASADGKADGKKKKHYLPENPAVYGLYRAIMDAEGSGRSETEIAEEFVHDREITGITAKSLLRKVRQFRASLES